MKNKFSKSELSNSIFMNYGDRKNRDLFVEQALALQDSQEDGQLEFEGKNGTYVFCKSGNIVTFKRSNGTIIRKKLEQ